MEEAKQKGVPVLNATPKVHCKVFEDNAGTIEIATVPKMRPRTKHLNIKYHHFREEVRKGTVSIYHTRTEDPIHLEQIHCRTEMRECEHTCSGALVGTLQGTLNLGSA
jgi:hypothetical protein